MQPREGVISYNKHQSKKHLKTLIHDVYQDTYLGRVYNSREILYSIHSKVRDSKRATLENKNGKLNLIADNDKLLKGAINIFTPPYLN